jgi:dienelactone hydrolase
MVFLPEIARAVQGDEAAQRRLAGADGLAASRHLAGLLWVHWLGEPASTNRTEFLDEALQLAPAGVVSLLVDTLWSTPDWYKKRAMDEDAAAFTAQVVDLRRAHLLATQPDVDPGRLGLVGHDFGAMTGMLAGAADGRPRVYVLLALTPEFENWMFYIKGKRPTDEAAYRKQLALLDPIDALPALGVPSLIQLAENDFYVPPEQIEAWKRAVAGHGELRTYPTGHGMEGPVVRTDRQAWLVVPELLPTGTLTARGSRRPSLRRRRCPAGPPSRGGGARSPRRW